MFGHTGNDSLAQKQEAERIAVERAMQGCRDDLKKMREATPDEAERMNKMLKDRCGQDKRLPFDFKRKVLERARLYECNANMRAADAALHAALRMAADEQMVQRAQKLGKAAGISPRPAGLGPMRISVPRRSV